MTITKKSLIPAILTLSVLSQAFIAPTMVRAQDASASQSEALVLKSYHPQYLSPVSIAQLLGAFKAGEGDFWRWIDDENIGELNIRLNPSANLVLFNGPEFLINKAMEIITIADVAPRQIEIEVRIVEINTSKAEDLGYDWSQFLRRARASVDWRYENRNEDDSRKDTQTGSSGIPFVQSRLAESETETRHLNVQASADLLGALNILEENGSGSVRVAPRILTLNNRSATIIDGQRVTYITRYSSYSNLFETDSMDAGLIIKVTPSIGRSGYITLDLATEFTRLGSNISGSPIKSGQIIENTIIVADGESALLGGFTRQVESVRHRRFPILGHLIPFLFSRKTTSYSDIETIIVLTPRVVDFETGLDASELDAIDGK